MQLNRLTERVWVYPFEEERDRPNLGYIRGDRWSLAVDAGHSAAHVRDFYGALEAAGLPLPALTVLTHWHWDHTFGMHAVHGLCLAGRRTDRYLADFRARPEAKRELLSAGASGSPQGPKCGVQIMASTCCSSYSFIVSRNSALLCTPSSTAGII